jgi:two-component system sensor histidine kinase MtrB
VPAQTTAGGPVRPLDAIGPRMAAVAPTADPTALPGNGARVVPRPASGTRRAEEPAPGAAAGRPADAESDESYE